MNNGYATAAVREFYDAMTDKFMLVYGDVIQSFRTCRIEDYLDYTMESADIRDGQIILDAGCGVGGPAIYFAQRRNITVYGCTISKVQSEIANRKIRDKKLQGRVIICEGDFHQLEKIYPRNFFDRVIFLESFGYAYEKSLPLSGSMAVLKPGGLLYIKDVFRKPYDDKNDQALVEQFIRDINEEYRFNMNDLNEVVDILRKRNFIFHWVKSPEIEPEKFENFKIVDEFQTRFNIVPSYDSWIFPSDYLEIRCMKPPYDPGGKRHLIYLERLKENHR